MPSRRVSAIGVAAVLIVAAFAIGWWVGQRAGPRLAALVHRWAGRGDGDAVRSAVAIVGMVLTAVPLDSTNSAPPRPTVVSLLVPPEYGV